MLPPTSLTYTTILTKGAKKKPKIWRRKTGTNTHVYYFYYYNEAGRCIAKSTGKTVNWQAEQEMKKFLSTPFGADMPFGKYAEGYLIWGQCDWIKRQHARGRSFSETMAKMRRSHLTRYILPTFKQTPPNKMNALDIEKWLASITKSAQTKKHMLVSLRPILRDAEREGLIPFNPADEVEALNIKPNSRDAFTKEELGNLFPRTDSKLLKVWGSHKYATAFLMLASAGLRTGDLRALKWEDVNLNEKYVSVSRALKASGEDGPTDTGASRVVILPSRTVALLRVYGHAQGDSRAESLVFPALGRATPMDRDTLRTKLSEALPIAKVKLGGRNLVVHSFRHTYVTLVRSVLPETALRTLTGHSSERMTDHYDLVGVELLAARLRPIPSPWIRFFQRRHFTVRSGGSY